MGGAGRAVLHPLSRVRPAVSPLLVSRLRPSPRLHLFPRLRVLVRRRALVGLLAITGMAGLVGAAAAVGWPATTRVAADGSQPPSGADSPQRAAPKPRAVAGAVSDIRARRTAPRDDPSELMQALADARARLMNSGDPRALGELDVPGSPAWSADQELLERLRGQGQRYAGVAFEVRSAREVRVEGSRAAMTVAVDTLPYRLVDRSGERHDKDAETGDELVIHLRWSGDTWLVEQLAAEPA
jgi:hypothetical protein